MDKNELKLSDISDITDYLGKWLWRTLDSGEDKFDVDALIKYLGERYRCERTYIFEVDYSNEIMNNTYEWCAEGVSPQKELLQNESLSFVDYWMELFKQKKSVIIQDIEKIKTEYPRMYALLKPQNIHSLIATPIYLNDRLIGFLGVDNPENLNEDEIIEVLCKMGALFSSIIKYRGLEEKVIYNQYHDQLTKAFNRAALERDFNSASGWKQLGVVSCDLSELKYTNEMQGFEEGDAMICRCNLFLKEIFSLYNIYRISGDRFVVVCPDIDNASFEGMVSILEAAINSRHYHLVYGSAWSNEEPLKPYGILAVAEQDLFRNKAAYFSKPDPKSGRLRERRIFSSDSVINNFDDGNSSTLYRFIENNYFSLDVFFKAMSISEHYPYFGDVQKDAWFISDALKDTWGFENNVVYDFLGKWKKFIPHKDDLDMYENDIDGLMRLKRDIHDLIYRVVDKDGEKFWIRCFGYIKWDEDRNNALFFCGHISRLNNVFDADPITNFPREKAAVRDISTIFYNKKHNSFLCFRLNGFGEINEIRGRNIGNNLLKDISTKLSDTFDKTVQFYRLDGLRFLVMLSEDCEIGAGDLSKEIKKIVSDLYIEYNLPIRYPCSAGILGELNPNMSVMEVMTAASSLLDIAKNLPDTDVVYSEQALSSHRGQKQMVLEISKDVANNMNNFRVVIQPIVSSLTHEIVGGELLLRWKYLDQNISPMVFVPILEENNLMSTVGKWIFKQAAKLCKRINSYVPDFYLDFNVSYHQIKDETLLPYMKKTLMDYNIDGDRLVMELTETHSNDDPIKLQQFIESCKHMNIRMALDDFGVGYSSFEMLLKYPADIIKLDRSIMKKMSDSSESKMFIATVVTGCHNFDRKVCVEGVETEEELKMVTEAGCDTIQGFYFYKPLEISNIYNLFVNME